VSRGITDDPEFEDEESSEGDIDLNELAEMVFIVFNEIKLVQEKLDRLLAMGEDG
jgi:hypothetical protein